MNFAVGHYTRFGPAATSFLHSNYQQSEWWTIK
jgi:hypothetical protein